MSKFARPNVEIKINLREYAYIATIFTYRHADLLAHIEEPPLRCIFSFKMQKQG